MSAGDLLKRPSRRGGKTLLQASLMTGLASVAEAAIRLASPQKPGKSKAAWKSGAFIRTKNVTYPLPARSAAVTGEHDDETRSGIAQPAGVWFREPVVEMCLRSDRLDQEITLLHLEGAGPRYQEEATEEDPYERFMRPG